MRNKLIPTPIVNKNGVQTTVHKKPADSAAPRSIPAMPALPMSDTDARLYEKVQENFPQLKGFSESWVKQTERDIAITFARIKRFPEETRCSLLARLESDAPAKDDLIRSVREGATVTTIREFLAHEEYLDDDGYFDMLRGLRYYPQLPKKADYSKADPETRAKVVALLTVVAKIHESAREHGYVLDEHPAGLTVESTGELRGASFLKGDELVQLIVDNPDEADHIADIILERKTGDAGFISSIINNPASSISEGVI